MSGQEQQQNSQQHRIQDEERVIDYDSNQDQVPGPLPRPTAASVPESRADHIDAEEDGVQCAIHAPCQPPEEDMEARVRLNQVLLSVQEGSFLNFYRSV